MDGHDLEACYDYDWDHDLYFASYHHHDRYCDLYHFAR